MSAPASGEPITLAEHGQPSTTIVVPSEASETVRGAADELRDYVRELVGVQLPLVSDDTEIDGPAILETRPESRGVCGTYW